MSGGFRKTDELAGQYSHCKNLAAAMEACGMVLCQTLPSTGYYVYVLCDPRDLTVFYVGKGKGKRALSHEAEWRNKSSANGAKARRIGEIKNAGLDVSIFIVAESDSEEVCFCIERKLIAAWRNIGLTNIASGAISPIEASFHRLMAVVERLPTRQEIIARCDAAILREYDEFAKIIESNKKWLLQRCPGLA